MSDTTVRSRRIPWRPILWGLAALPILAPLVAMRFTAEVQWTALDFAFAIAVIGSAGVAIEIAVRRSPSGFYRAGAAVAALGALVLLWINGAVGIIGGAAEDANLLYLGVVGVALGGSLVARLRSRGVARAMLAAAATQLAVPFAADMLLPSATPAVAQPEVIGLTAIFTLVWLTAASLFRRSA
ncbi:MAG: hypothetical protein INF91_12140 [Alphaproteobacteria bacterium]|nr:hypothetical protein [Alphaproteobacteria bacterium]